MKEKASLIGVLGGVDRDKAVLDFGELGLDNELDLFGDFVGFAEAFVAVDEDGDFDVDPVAEEAGAETVDAEDVGLFEDEVADGVFGGFVGGVVGHFVDGAAEDVEGGFDDEETDTDGGDAVENGEAKARAENGEEAADGRK